MSDTWRRKSYYRPRVLASIDAFLAEPTGDVLLCVTNNEASLLLGLLEYAHRRATWVSEYRDAYYLAPTNEQWDAVQAAVATLEDKLMVGCCDAILEKLEEILTALELQEQGQADRRLGEVVPRDWQTLPDVENYFEWGNELPNTIFTTGSDPIRCAVAQLWYQGGYELITESVLPAFRAAWSSLLPAAAAVLASWTGGLSIPVLMGVWAAQELFEQLGDVGYDSAETNFVNWLIGAKEEIICSMYRHLAEHTQVSPIVQAVYQEVVVPSTDLSYGDKLIWRVFAGALALLGARKAYDEDTGWAEYYVTPGYCDDCAELEIVEGSDWYAIPISPALGYIRLAGSGLPEWTGGCVPLGVNTSDPCVGVVFEVDTIVAGCVLKRMTAVTAGCSSEHSMFPDTSGNQAEGWHFDVVPFRIDDVEAKAALCPTATVYNTCQEFSGPGIVVPAFQVGYECTGVRDVWVRYLVFEKP